MVRFSKFGFGSLLAGIVMVGVLIQYLYLPATASGQYLDAFLFFVIDLIKGAVNWISVGLIITGILLFVL